jgi:hypothetical protein
MERFYKLLNDGVRPELVAKLMERNNCQVFLGRDIYYDLDYHINHDDWIDDFMMVMSNGNVIPAKDMRTYYDSYADEVYLFEVDYDTYHYSLDDVLLLCKRYRPELKVVESKPYTWYELAKMRTA